ncbi:hypothetical protein F0562_001145 [Nyssa sinensis]|uniref:CCT domain-containing protein n=1 Tax=Nyssa sinensis TaxID=561372 RepID=A0A5J5C751_9ASTE|nr:hypothetical protein F0562_001145 [Nyssa sinensis]
MGHNSLLKSPKKEEQQVPDTVVPKLLETNHLYSDKVDELEDILGIEDDENLPAEGNMYGQLNWEQLMDWEEFSIEEGEQKVENASVCFEERHYRVKKENDGFWDEDDEKRLSLNLSLNYQKVLDAWSDRGSLWVDDCSISMANNCYMGEGPVMKEDRTRREASVLRYKEKRQTRLFSKKIRYQVRKLIADKRPRLKGRFVKRGKGS